MFDGTIERTSCITKHDDFSFMSNRRVLIQVAPLLRDRCGRGYRHRGGQTENELVTKMYFLEILHLTLALINKQVLLTFGSLTKKIIP